MTQLNLFQIETILPTVKTAPAQKPSEKELIQHLKNRNVKDAIVSGEKKRLFYSACGRICAFKKGSTRKGYPVEYSDIQSVNIITDDQKKKEKEDSVFSTLQKFRSYASKATFTNEFIEQCKNTPATKEQWEADGSKSPYEYGVTTGCSITGKIVSVETICKKIGNNGLKDAIQNKYGYSARFEYDGYDGSVSIEIRNGLMYGYLSKEYRNCGNGYYFLLVNDENFIGYDVD